MSRRVHVCLGLVDAASYNTNRIGGVIVGVFASGAIDRGFQPRSGHTKDYKNSCFSGKHAALKRKSKDWSARDKDNVCELGDMSIRALLF